MKTCFGLLPGLSRTVSGINSNFRRKSPIFPNPCIVPAGIGYRPRAPQSFNPALAPAPLGGGIKRCYCLTSVCRLSVVYITSNSRTERPRKTKIGTEIAHVTCDSDTTFKVKRSKSPGRFAHRRLGASGDCSGERGNVLAVGNCSYVAVCLAAQGASAPTEGRRGAGHIVAAARLTACFFRGTRKNQILDGFSRSMAQNARKSSLIIMPNLFAVYRPYGRE